MDSASCAKPWEGMGKVVELDADDTKVIASAMLEALQGKIRCASVTQSLRSSVSFASYQVLLN